MAKRDIAAADPLAGIAREAHAAWCRRMIEEGWSPGDRYDENARMHDALVPFDRLPQPVRGWLIDIMRVEEVEKTLADFIEHPRGPDRPFSIDEMRVGFPIREIRCERVGAKPKLGHLGRVVSWTADRYGGLHMIRVRWDDGEETEHTFNADEIRRG